MTFIGYFSLPVVSLTSFFTGGALALQIYYGGNQFNSEAIVSSIVALGITRELDNSVESWSYNKLNEVVRIAPIVKAKMKKNGII